jgi:hypothetical protein
MRGKLRLYLIGAGIAGLLALAGCGGGMWQFGAERAAWRSEAEAGCMNSGAIPLNAGVVQMSSIDGPGVCGADYPLKVSMLGEGGTALGYGDEIRPPAAIPSASMPRWPVSAPRQYGAPPRSLDQQARDLAAPPPAAPMNIAPSGIDNYMLGAPARPAYAPPRDLHPQDLHPQPGTPAYDPPRTVAPRYTPPPQDDVADDIPDDAILPGHRAPARQTSAPPRYRPPPQSTPKLGPARPMPVTQVKAAVSPPATLACPIVTALDKWVSESVQPAALRWFNQPVVEIKQISSYSCRGMVGASGHHISEHAFGNALDIAGFVLADGRKVMVKTGWHGAPEEAGFLHDVQGAACSVFTTVLAPGYNKYHYDHIHVDLMRRASGRTPCRPTPIPGEVAAAKQAKKSKYAHRGERLTTGSIGGKVSTPVKVAIPGEDGFDEND